MGLVFAVIGLIANQIWKLIRSRSEGARRLKLVAGIALFLLVAALMVEGMGVLGAIGTGVVIAAIVWVIKGFKAKDPSPAQPTQPTQSRWTESEPVQPSPEREVVLEPKTVIVCPNCGGKLRVLAGKYIDVTCPHCQTEFRIHT